MTATTPPAASPVERFETRDGGTAEEHVQEMYGLNPGASLQSAPTEVHCQTSGLDLGPVALTRLRYGPYLEAQCPRGIAQPTFLTPHNGAKVAYEAGRTRYAFDRTQSLSVPALTPYSASLHDCDATIVQIDPTPVAADLGVRQLRFLPGVVSDEAALHWRSVVSLVDRVLASAPEALEQPLVRQEIARVISTAAVAVFPHQDHEQPSASPATPAALARATAFIDEHADLPISIADVAAAARVGPRTLQDLFRRHRDVSPMEYLRHVRLDLAHQELVANATADDDDRSVAAVAHRWGFANAGRFARLHHERYGTMPRDVAAKRRR